MTKGVEFRSRECDHLWDRVEFRSLDSLYTGTIDDDFAEQLRVTYRKLFPKKNLTVQVIRVQQQQGCTDCGLHAIAFAVDLAMGCTHQPLNIDK